MNLTATAGYLPVAGIIHWSCSKRKSLTNEDIRVDSNGTDPTRNELLSGTALSLIRGPSDSGVYTLTFTDPQGTNGRLDQPIAALRANAQVKFADPAVNDAVAWR